MKKLFITILSVTTFFQAGYSQSVRRTINFNYGWEMYRIDSAHSRKNTVNLRGSSFLSQFNQESIKAKGISPDSIRRFEVNEAVKGYEAEYPQIKSLQWEKISLPHPARYEQELNPNVNQFTGICYYRKQFEIPAGVENKNLYLQFEGAMQTASVWLNGKYITQHQGGYLPFVVPLDGNIKAGGKNEIIVRLDNNDNVNVPPGKPLAKLGFLYWSGIYRDVWLIETNKVYITNPVTANTVAGGGVFARPDNISAESADVIIKTQLKNDLNISARASVKQILVSLKNKNQRILDTLKTTIDGNTVVDLNQKITVPQPDLWSTDEPNLYLLTTEVWVDGKLTDKLSQKIGIRKLTFTRAEGFKLNDQPLRITGTNRHQDCPFVGNALSDEMQYRDLKMIKEAGFNFVRLSHYPQDPSIFKYCDSIGLLLCDPIPGWQFFNHNGIFKDRVFSDIRQMIRRDRNHPSVIMWEVSLNETYPDDSFRIKSAAIAHEEYPGTNFFTSGDTYAAKHTEWDVPYNSWEDPFGRPQDVQPDKAGFAREYGDYEFGGSESTTRVNRSNGEKALLQNAWNFQWEHNLLMGPKYYPWTAGDATWAFFDGFEATTKNTSDWGAVDIYRIPKFSYYFFRSQLNPDKPVFAAGNKPMVYIADWWTPTSKPEKVIVYANCDEVALYSNGKLIKKQHPDAGPDSDYGDYDKGGNPFDGGNSKHLAYPPYTFTGIKWQAGELKAIGYIQGKKVAEQIVRSPMTKTRLKLMEATGGIPLTANGADAVFIRAQVVDHNGTVICLDNDTEVKFTVKGNGKIISPATVKVRGGIASVLLRADNNPGHITITAAAKGLEGSKLNIKSKVN